MKKAYRIPSDKDQVKLPFLKDDLFDRWAKKFFKSRKDKFIPYNFSLDRFRIENGLPGITSLQFKKKLTNWCVMMKYELDPKELHNSAGRIIRKHQVTYGKFVATEMLYVKTKKDETN